MDQIVNFLSRIEVIIAFIVIIILLVIYLIVHQVRIKTYKKELAKLEVRYNSIKSVPLPFKLNKAVAIGKIDSKVADIVTNCQDDFDQCQANLRQIAESLADADDNIVMGKIKVVKLALQDLATSIDLGEQQVSAINNQLDLILEKETAQRAEVTVLKERFRNLKQAVTDKSQLLAFAWPKVELEIGDIEKMFSAFEEWMYASDFEKATEKLSEIRESIDHLEYINEKLPKILQVSRYTIPDLISDVNKRYISLADKGLYVSHLEVETNLNTITSSLKQDIEALKVLELKDIKEHLTDYHNRLMQLDEALKNEAEAYDKIKNIGADITRLCDESKKHAKYIKEEFENASVRFGIENLGDLVDEAKEVINEVNVEKTKVYDDIKSDIIPSSKAYDRLDDLCKKIQDMHDRLKEKRDIVANARGDEDRAQKQLLKLQLIMNEMQVKIESNRLPAISDSYNEDLNKAYQYIGSIKKLIKQMPLNVQLLNSTLNDAIDFIYKLWNNVNNVVGTAVMVENSIVFGNKYRSTYPDIDSELTRAELCFRNGEYTQALKIALATIEKIHPGISEKLIKENSRGA